MVIIKVQPVSKLLLVLSSQNLEAKSDPKIPDTIEVFFFFRSLMRANDFGACAL